MTDEQTDDDTKAASTDTGSRMRGGGPIDPRYAQRNLASRLFPGPSELMSRQVRKRIEGLLTPLDSDTALDAQRGKSRRPAAGAGSRPTRTVSQRSGATESLNVATPEDIAEVRDKLDEQNELLRAILASSVDTQEDARSTAQNSRTFAWAGTAIALLTLVATVISVLAAIRE